MAKAKRTPHDYPQLARAAVRKATDEGAGFEIRDKYADRVSLRGGGRTGIYPELLGVLGGVRNYRDNEHVPPPPAILPAQWDAEVRAALPEADRRKHLAVHVIGTGSEARAILALGHRDPKIIIRDFAPAAFAHRTPFDLAQSGAPLGVIADALRDSGGENPDLYAAGELGPVGAALYAACAAPNLAVTPDPLGDQRTRVLWPERILSYGGTVARPNVQWQVSEAVRMMLPGSPTEDGQPIPEGQAWSLSWYGNSAGARQRRNEVWAALTWRTVRRLLRDVYEASVERWAGLGGDFSEIGRRRYESVTNALPDSDELVSVLFPDGDDWDFWCVGR